jgi:hypothetical protein
MWLSATAPTGTTTKTIAKTAISNASAVRGYMVGDLILITDGTEQGNIYKITAVTAMGANLTVALLSSFRGGRGASIFTTSTQIATIGTTSVPLNTITLPTGMSVQVGDLLLSSTSASAGAMGSVTAVGTTAATVQFLFLMGGSGMNLLYKGEWDASVEYVRSENRTDIVTTTEGTFACLQTNTSVEPNDFDASKAYWQRISLFEIPTGSYVKTLGGVFHALSASDISVLSTSTASTATVTLANGDSFTKAEVTEIHIQKNFMPAIVPAYFLANFVSAKISFEFADGTSEIKNNFLYNASNFNMALSLPDTIQAVGDSFMVNTDAFTKSLNIGNLGADVFVAGATLSTANANSLTFTLGFTITGTNRDAFIAKFPNIYAVGSMYRNLEGRPFTFHFATDSWADIESASSAGTAVARYWIGEEKDITVGTETLTVQIIDFDHDDKSDGSGKAGITVAMKNLMAATKQMETSNINTNGWNGCEMKTTTLAGFLSQLPADLQAVIKEVNKPTSSGGNTSPTIVNSQDKLFLLSSVECFGTNQYSLAGEGSQYGLYNYMDWSKTPTSSLPARVKKLSNGTGLAYNWWLRSPYSGSTTYFVIMNNIGTANYYNASYTIGVCFGFAV